MNGSGIVVSGAREGTGRADGSGAADSDDPGGDERGSNAGVWAKCDGVDGGPAGAGNRRGDADAVGWCGWSAAADRKSTRLNSSHLVISYAVFCLEKKTTAKITSSTP